MKGGKSGETCKQEEGHYLSFFLKSFYTLMSIKINIYVLFFLFCTVL